MAGTQERGIAPTELAVSDVRVVVKGAAKRMKILNIPLLASGLAFWATLSIFPALIALIMVYGLVSSPQDVTHQVSQALGSVSQDAKSTITAQLTQIAAGKGGALSVGLVISLLVLLWSASSGVQNLMTAVTTAYEQKETRGFLKLRAQALLFTVVALVLAVLMIGAVGVVPPVLARALGSGPTRYLLLVVEYAIVFVLVVAVIAALYRFAPANRPSGWRWASFGAVLAGALWTVATILFAVYVNHFSSYNRTYGALAGVIVLMLWFYLSAFVILFGALVNAESERALHGGTLPGPERADVAAERVLEDRPASDDRLQAPALQRRGS